MPPISLIIIGAGPAGYECAVRAAKRGVQVTLIEEKSVGGVCLREGCIPTKCLCRTAELLDEINAAASFGICLPEGTPRVDLAQAVGRKDSVVANLMQGVSALLKHPNIRLVEGRAQFAPDGGGKTVIVNGERLTADYIIIATGSRPRPLPIPGADLDGVVTSTELLSETTLPESLAIIGGGVIGLELATVFSTFGAKVTVVEFMREVLPGFDRDMAKRLRTALKRRGIDFRLNAAATAIERNEADGKLLLHFTEKEKPQSVCADRVLICVGRQPNVENLGLDNAGIDYGKRGITVDEHLQTNVKGVYAAGDVNGRLLLAHAATRQAYLALDHLLHDAAPEEWPAPQPYTAEGTPSVVFTHPELAAIGPTEEHLEESGTPFASHKARYASNGKAMAEGAGDGMLKILATPDGKILAAHILGHHAADLIHEVAALISQNATLADLQSFVHAHPTLSELLVTASEG